MAIITHDCPRCGGNSLGFKYVGFAGRLEEYEQALFFRCPRCFDPITVFVHNPESMDYREEQGDIRDRRFFPYLSIQKIEPASPVPLAPNYTPEQVADYYVEALDGLHRRKWTSAASLLRKCLEVALKKYSPEIEAWKLEKRIDKLAAENKITPALRDWAHELRLDGNEALHGDEPADEELATRMERLTYFLLTYLYTLPAQVEAARAARENGTD